MGSVNVSAGWRVSCSLTVRRRPAASFAAQASSCCLHCSRQHWTPSPHSPMVAADHGLPPCRRHRCYHHRRCSSPLPHLAQLLSPPEAARPPSPAPVAECRRSMREILVRRRRRHHHRRHQPGCCFGRHHRRHQPGCCFGRRLAESPARGSGRGRRARPAPAGCS